MSHETDGVDGPSNSQAEEETLSKVENFPAPIGELLGLKLIQPEKGISLGVSTYYWNRPVQQEEKSQFVGDDIPTIESVFDLKSGARAKLVDRRGAMVIIEIDKYRSDWIEWSEVKARIAAKDR
jgi:hypothetical protein